MTDIKIIITLIKIMTENRRTFMLSRYTKMHVPTERSHSQSRNSGKAVTQCHSAQGHADLGNE